MDRLLNILNFVPSQVIFWLAFLIIFPIVIQQIYSPSRQIKLVRPLLVAFPFFILLSFAPIMYLNGVRWNFFQLALQGYYYFAGTALAYLVAWLLLLKRIKILNFLSLGFYLLGVALAWLGMTTYFPDYIPKNDPSVFFFVLWQLFFIGPWILVLFYFPLLFSYIPKEKLIDKSEKEKLEIISRIERGVYKEYEFDRSIILTPSSLRFMGIVVLAFGFGVLLFPPLAIHIDPSFRGAGILLRIMAWIGSLYFICIALFHLFFTPLRIEITPKGLLIKRLLPPFSIDIHPTNIEQLKLRWTTFVWGPRKYWHSIVLKFKSGKELLFYVYMFSPLTMEKLLSYFTHQGMQKKIIEIEKSYYI